MNADALSYERISQARETLTAAAAEALRGRLSGAIDAEEPFVVFVEAKRNLTAAVMEIHGEDAWQRMLAENTPVATKSEREFITLWRDFADKIARWYARAKR